MVQPSIFLAVLASLTARSIEFFMPRPSEASEPVSGPTKPILTVFASSLGPASPPDSSRLQPAARMTRVPSTATRRRSLWLPFKVLPPSGRGREAPEPSHIDRPEPSTDARRVSASLATVRRTSHRSVWPGRDGVEFTATRPAATTDRRRGPRLAARAKPGRSAIMAWRCLGHARVPPAAIAAGLLLVALIAVGQVTSGSLPSSSTRPPGGLAARPTIPPDPPSPVVARVEVPGNPQRLAFGFGTVWVTNSNGTVSRIDPASDQVVATIPLPRAGRRPEAIATGAGMVWVAASAGMVWRIDPARNQVVGQVDTGRLLYKPIGLAVQDDAVWVVCCANAAPGRHPDGKLIRIDPAAGRVAARIAVRGDPFAVATEPGAVWVATAPGSGRAGRPGNQPGHGRDPGRRPARRVPGRRHRPRRGVAGRPRRLGRAPGRPGHQPDGRQDPGRRGPPPGRGRGPGSGW